MKNKGISLISIIIIIFILIIIVSVGVILINRRGQDSKETYFQPAQYIAISSDFDEKKELINELNNKFYNGKNLKNYYIAVDDNVSKTEVFVLDNKVKSYTTHYHSDSEGNINKDEIFVIDEAITIDDMNYHYHYADNVDENDSEYMEAYKFDKKIDSEEYWRNFIFPSKALREEMSEEELEYNMDEFIDSVTIERDNNNVIFSLDSELDFFNWDTGGALKKVLVVDARTGCPLSMTTYDVTGNEKPRRTYKYEYKLNCCTDEDFDISKYEGIEIIDENEMIEVKLR